MKRNVAAVRALLQELHYHQLMVRVDLRAARAGVRKCKEIGEQIRNLRSGRVTAEKQVGRPVHEGDDWQPVQPVVYMGPRQLPLIY